MNPASGRFWTLDGYEGTTFDPISLHKYLYGNANPVNRTDPSGYSATTIDQLITVGIIGTLATMTALVLRQVVDEVYKETIRIRIYPRPTPTPTPQPSPSPIIDLFPIPQPSPSPSPDEVVYLFHGTSMEAAQSINTIGVNEGEILKYRGSNIPGALYVFLGKSPFKTDPAFQESLYAGAARRSNFSGQAVIVGQLPRRVLAELEAQGRAGSGRIDPNGPLFETWFLPSSFPGINQYNPPNHWIIYPVKAN